MVVEGKVIGGDDVDTGILLDLPVGESEALALGQEIGLRELAGPVSFGGLLEVSEDANSASQQCQFLFLSISRQAKSFMV